MPGAIAGFILGEAAHRLVKNTLNIKPTGSPSGMLESSPSRNVPGYYTVNRPRPAGPSGYEGGFFDDSSYHGCCNSSQGITGVPRFSPSSNGVQGQRNNLKTQDRLYHQEQYQDLRTGMSALSMEETVRSRAHADPQRMPNSGYSPNRRNQFVQNTGVLPSPPTKWINRPANGNGGMYYRQEGNSGGVYEKQVKKIYQVKAQGSSETPDPINNQ